MLDQDDMPDSVTVPAYRWIDSNRDHEQKGSLWFHSADPSGGVLAQWRADGPTKWHSANFSFFTQDLAPLRDLLLSVAPPQDLLALRDHLNELFPAGVDADR